MEELPLEFKNSMQLQLGDQEAAQLFCALNNTESPVSIRLNPNKPLPAESPIGQRLTPVPWCTTGYFLPERPQFTLDPLFHAGCYYVQEASSMFIEQAWRVINATEGFTSDLKLLDLCAAPGGKSTLWRTLLPEDAFLVANEPNRQRAEILNENLQKWGHPNVMVTNAYAVDFAAYAPGFFDVLAADVPCSGEGMFRKDPNSRMEWNPENVEKCALLQRSIIEDAWSALRPGGFLVYSTCTYNSHEDEENVQWIAQELGADIVKIPVEEGWGIVTGEAGYHFYPHRVKGEGFYLALLRKHGGDDYNPYSRSARKQRNPRLDFIRHFDWLPFEQKGKKQIPQHVLAMNPDTAGNFPHHELTHEQALQYLRRESIVLNEAPRGYIVVCYKGLALGFVNNLGSRANNMYPQEWRIRHL